MLNPSSYVLCVSILALTRIIILFIFSSELWCSFCFVFLRFPSFSFHFVCFAFIFFYCLLYTGYSFAFGCFLSPFSRSVYLGCWLVCVVVLEYPVRCHGIALSHVLTVRVLHYYPLCRTCDHRACISLESTGCR